MSALPGRPPHNGEACSRGLGWTGVAPCRPGDQDLVSLCVKARGAQPSGHEGQSHARCCLRAVSVTLELMERPGSRSTLGKGQLGWRAGAGGWG